MSLSVLTQWIRSHGNRSSYTYNVLAWSYGILTRQPAVRRAARKRLLKDGRFEDDELWMASGCPQALLDAVIDIWRPRTVLDVGCGVGLAMEYLIGRGVECVGLEGSTAAIAQSPVQSHIRLVNLNQPQNLGRRFDVVWSYEVAEHIHPAFEATFVDTLTSHGDCLVLSAARPGQGGCGHVNEQPQEYWVRRLGDRGFRFDESTTASLQRLPDEHARNVMVFHQ